jgi:hypothetical protein
MFSLPGSRGAKGRKVIRPVHVGGARNALQISDAKPSVAPSITAVGGDTNIGLIINPKGTGVVTIGGPLTVTGTASLLAGSINGTVMASSLGYDMA